MRNILRYIGIAATTVAIVLGATVLGVTNPAAAATGATVEVNGGVLTINGTAETEQIQVNQIGSGAYAVWITPEAGIVEVHNVAGVTGDVLIAADAGSDRISIGDATATSLPDSLIIKPAPGYNSVTLENTTVADDLIVSGEADVRLHTSHIGDDVVGSSGPRNLGLSLYDSTVGDFLQTRSTQRGLVATSFTRSSVGRVRLIGNSANDSVRAVDSDLGLNPRFDLGTGNDSVKLGSDTTWTGTATYNAGNGDDRFEIDEGLTSTVALGKLNVQLGNGDDDAEIKFPVTAAGSVINGQGGFDRLTGSGHSHPTSNASYRLFEDIEGGPENQVVTIEASGDGDLAINVLDTVYSLRIDGAGDGFKVAYRKVVTLEWVEETFAAIDGDVSLTLESPLLTTDIGSQSQTNFPGDLNITANEAQGRMDLFDITVAGDLRATGAGESLSMDLFDIEVAGRLDARATGLGRFSILSWGSNFGRVRLNGANRSDFFYADENSNLGINPVAILRGGNDGVVLPSATWSGLFQLNTGSGDDAVTAEGQMDRVRMVMGAGDDTVTLDQLAAEGQGSIIQGDSGTDTLIHRGSIANARVRTFEEITQAP